MLFENDNHNHPGNTVSGEVRLFEEKVRDRAVNCNESTQTVIDHYLTNVSDHAVARLPKFKHIKRNIQNQCGKNDLRKIPQDQTFDTIPDKLAKTKRNSQCLQFDSGPGNDRVIIFSSPEQLKLLENWEQLLVDGTFKVSTISLLLFIIVGKINLLGYA